MKIIHVIVSLRIVGGAELMLERLLKSSCADDNVSLIVITLIDSGDLGIALKKLGIKVIDLNIKSKFGLIFALIKLVLLFKKLRPDVVQTWMYHADLLGGLAGKICGINKIVWNIRNTEIPPSRLSGIRLLRGICGLLSNYIPKAIVCNSTAGLKTHSKLGYPLNKMSVIPNGFDSNVWKRKKIGAPIKNLLKPHTDCPFVVGTVGRYDYLKGFDIFIEAASIVASQSSRPFLFLMVGRQVDEGNSDLMFKIQQKGGNAIFKLLGERKDVSEIMQLFDVFCLPSRAEGFPNVIAEAMLSEKVCVATDVGDTKKILGANGVVVPPENPDLLAQALLKIERVNKIKLFAKGKSSRERIVERYDIKKIKEIYFRLYEEI